MRIALVHPTYWPEVRRGSERLVHDLGITLAGRGHDVTVLTTHPSSSSRTDEEGMHVVRARRFPQPPTLGLHEDWLGTVPRVAWEAIRGDFDVLHAFHLSSAWAALQARRAGAPPVVFSFHGMPTRQHLVSRRYRLEMMQAVVAGAAATSVLSEAAAELFRRYLLRRPLVLPGGVLLERFRRDAPRARVPTLLCTASIGDPRKRGDLLLAGFRHLRDSRPDARLRVARSRDPHMSPYSFELPEGAEWFAAGSTEELAKAYSGSWASVLTAEEEPFGLVLVESLAAGTPVAAARSGSCAEIIDSDRVGALFEGDGAEAVAAAMESVLELAVRPETADACVERAADFDWSRVVEGYEEVYERIAAQPGSR